MSDKYYTLKQVSNLFITPVPYLRYLIKSHKLKSHFIGRQYIVTEEDLKQFISKFFRKKMRLDKQIMDALGLNNTTITFGLDEDIQITIKKR